MVKDRDCSSLCCEVETNSVTVERTQGPVIRPIDTCNNKTCYFGVLGTDFKFGMPVKPAAGPGEVKPSLDGSDAIGMAVCTKTAVTGDDKIFVIRTGVVCWSDIAENLGLDPLSEADWWKIHPALAALNIYVEFK